LYSSAQPTPSSVTAHFSSPIPSPAVR
jgi:hypothetical protein